MGHFNECRQDFSFLVVMITETPVAAEAFGELVRRTTSILQDDGASLRFACSLLLQCVDARLQNLLSIGTNNGGVKRRWMLIRRPIRCGFLKTVVESLPRRRSMMNPVDSGLDDVPLVFRLHGSSTTALCPWA